MVYNQFPEFFSVSTVGLNESFPSSTTTGDNIDILEAHLLDFDPNDLNYPASQAQDDSLVDVTHLESEKGSLGGSDADESEQSEYLLIQSDRHKIG